MKRQALVFLIIVIAATALVAASQLYTFSVFPKLALRQFDFHIYYPPPGKVIQERPAIQLDVRSAPLTEISSVNVLFRPQGSPNPVPVPLSSWAIDRSQMIQALAEHSSLPPGAGDFIVSATNNRGVTVQKSVSVSLNPSTLQPGGPHITTGEPIPGDWCSCDRMTVKTFAPSFFDIPSNDEIKWEGLSPGTQAVIGDWLGPNPPPGQRRISWQSPSYWSGFFNFEVESQLRGTHTLCPHAQLIASTFTYTDETGSQFIHASPNNLPFSSPYNSLTCPYIQGDFLNWNTFCFDGYDKEGEFTKTENMILRWFDSPGLLRARNGYPASFYGKFIAYVNPIGIPPPHETLQQCNCYFEYHLTLGPDGRVQTNQLIPVGGANCNFDTGSE